ncbi:PI31 proteasome regulator [Akanthomyces lecanii RCEF 1005]|uniref:PI31 proteasome regulator n=1 Tax=Akanthomyces lecanii RCEF 1005 TaxID=1081108 RepID=A0A162KAX5_CORDF|nr:PI31 proteasome regulator [Akanthomyces lecanii RCEF 1005]
MSALSTTAVLEGMAKALPTHTQGDDSSDLASSYEAIGLLVHSYLTALGFKLVGFHEDRPLAECESLAPRLPASWNAGFGSLGFVYTHGDQQQDAKPTTYIFRVDKMGARVEIRGTRSSPSSSSSDTNGIHRFDVAIRDVVQSSNLPVRITLDADGNDTSDRQDLVDKLHRVFVSSTAVATLLQDVRTKIVQNLLGSGAAAAQVEARADSAAEERRLREERFQQERQDPNHPLAGRAQQPSPADMPVPRPGELPESARPRPGAPSGEFMPPGFEDEYDINRPPAGMGGHGGLVMPGSGRSPFNIGHDDLHPPGLGPNDPFRGSGLPSGLGGSGGFGSGGGMHPTFDDPLFAGQGGRTGPGQGSGGEFDPQVPPGARYDPLGPGGGPRFPGPGSGQGGHPFGGGGII